MPLRLLVIAAVASIVLLVLAQLLLGWTLDAQEKSFVVLLVLLATFAGSRLLKTRRKGGADGN
jgi:hypothetical protein